MLKRQRANQGKREKRRHGEAATETADAAAGAPVASSDDASEVEGATTTPQA